MLDRFSRTRMILGEDGMKRLFAAHAAVFGAGLAAERAAETLVRSGIGALDIFGDVSVKDRLIAINPELDLRISQDGVGDLQKYDYIIDITENPKTTAALAANAGATPMISVTDVQCRTDVSALAVGDINKIKSSGACALRYELRKRGVKKLRCVYSTEQPSEYDSSRLVPGAAGIIAAGEAVKDISSNVF